MGKKILLADDSITIQKVIELTFSDEDFEVVTVGNGRLAIERVQEVRPDVVLCDIIMPEKDGYEVCDFIKKTPSLAQIPVLLLTGAFEPFDQERAARVGCDGFLAKPFEPQTLIAKVKDLLKQAESRPSAAPAPAPPAAVSAPPPLSATPFSVIPPVAAPVLEPTALDDEPFFAEPESEPEPLVSAAPPPPAPSPVPVPAPPSAREPEVQFIPEEPYDSADHAPAPPTQASFHEYEPTFEPEPMPLPEPLPLAEPEPAPEAAAPDLEPMSLEPEPESYAPLEEEGGEELLPMTPEEEATLAQAAASPPTIEVPLEERAQASVEAAQEPVEEPFFEEVFEAEPEPPPVYVPPAPTYAPPPLPPEPVPAPFTPAFAAASELPPAAPPESGAPYELEQTLIEDAETVLEGVEAMRAAQSAPPSEPSAPALPVVESFRDVMMPEPKAPPAPPSHAAEIPIPVDMVSQIAQRVVGQISEKVIREIAWEVIPDLAEALIKREIERIKAEMQR
jgi:CheY-like chemotaxis protein